MLSWLTRIFLALALAVSFAGRVEAATQHCIRLIDQANAAAEPAPGAETQHCHEAATAGTQAAGKHHAPTPHPAGGKMLAHCQCIATTIACAAAGEASSSRVAAYAWLAPEEVRFVSSKPDPDLRPPRA